MTEYSHFDNTYPCYGAVGSEQPCLLATDTTPVVVAHGSTTATASKAVTTGLTTIVAAGASIYSSATPSYADGNAGGTAAQLTVTWSGGTLTIYGWALTHEASTNFTPATIDSTVKWWAMGT